MASLPRPATTALPPSACCCLNEDGDASPSLLVVRRVRFGASDTRLFGSSGRNGGDLNNYIPSLSVSPMAAKPSYN